MRRALKDYEDPENEDAHGLNKSVLSHLENSKKLSVSQKLFKLRYLCKCHLQLCAVQSQLNKHRDALHHGQMASIYCQELIRNSLYLCQSYIGDLMEKDRKMTRADLGDKKLAENYYVESDRALLELLTKNCLPILKEMLTQIDNFNKYNKMGEKSKELSEFEQDLHELLESKD